MSRTKDFNLLKVADVSANSTNTNSVSVVVNTDNGSSQNNSSNERSPAYNADNVMAALAVGQHFGVALEDAVAAIEAYVPSNNRSQMTKTGHNTLIVDAYNANPTSMAASIFPQTNISHPWKKSKVSLSLPHRVMPMPTRN